MVLPFFLIVLIVGFLLWFFSRANVEFSNPTADMESAMGRTTIYQYRSKIPKGKGEIVMVHGFCENQLYFETVAETLTAAGYDCIALNLFGYNASLPNNSYYSVKDYSDQICEGLRELERLQLVKNLVVVWGHSMGAAAVFLASSRIVNDHPEIEGIFLENLAHAENMSLLSKALKPLSALANFHGPRFVTQLFTTLLFVGNIESSVGKKFIKRMVVNYAPKREVAVKNLKSISQFKFDLQNISDKALNKLHFIISKKDKLISFRKTENTVIEKLSERDFPREQMLTLPNTDHFVSLQAPDNISTYVLRNLREKRSDVPSETLI